MADVWDGYEVKLNFRRNFDEKMLESWFELEEITKSINYKPGGDALVWVYNSNGVYSTQSLYTIINFRGVQPVFVPAVWKISVPPRIHVFLWLLSNNKLMTVDNLADRGIIKPPECQFCGENESINHLFFDCIVAKQLWACLLDFNGVDINSYLDMAGKWLAEKRYKAVNTISAGVVWSLWLT